MTIFQQHKQQWENCRKCHLCHGRSSVVIARGKVPADVVFVGEAPGASEDVLGQPFVGPAGKLLDRIIAEAMGDSGLRWAFTNLVGCIPLGEDGVKTAEPSKESIAACKPRLDHFIKLCSPRLVVCVGVLAAKNVAAPKVEYLNIVHPAAILRADISTRGLMIQRCIVALANAVETLVE